MQSNDSLFPEFKPATYEEWYAAAEKLLKGAPFDKKMNTKTPEGIVLKPIYNRSDVGFEPSLPGFGDFVRGVKPDGNKTSPWLISQEISAVSPDEFNAKILDALNKGQTSVEIVLDAPSAESVDAADAAEADVGKGGLSAFCAQDFKKALKGVAVECIDVNISAKDFALPAFAAFLAAADGRKISGSIRFDPVSALAQNGSSPRPIKDALDEMHKIAAYCAKHAPQFGAIGIDTMAYSSAGASAVEELACAFATAAFYIREMLARGMSIDAVAPLVRFRFALGGNFFMEIAKFRAARVLWSNVVRAFGGAGDSLKIKVNARTAFFNKTKFDPYVNMLRTTTEAFSGVVGGVDSMTVGAFDEILRASDEFSERIARNQQIILQEECGLSDVADPAGGSYFVETLTRQLASKAWELFAEMEKAGGMLEALKSGFVQEKIEAVAALRRKGYDSRRSSVVGTNNYANLSEKPLENVSADAVAAARKQRVADSRQMKKPAVKVSSVATVEDVLAALKAGATFSALRGALCKSGAGESVKALPSVRAVEHFEKLRMASAEFKNRTGSVPKIFLLTMGPLVQHKIRADFIRGFFEVGGFDVVYPNGFADAQAAADAFAQSGCKYAVICSTDATYPELVPAVCSAVKKSKPDAVVYMAGAAPAELEGAFKDAGCDGYVNIKSNNYGVLKAVLADLGVL